MEGFFSQHPSLTVDLGCHAYLRDFTCAGSVSCSSVQRHITRRVRPLAREKPCSERQIVNSFLLRALSSADMSHYRLHWAGWCLRGEISCSIVVLLDECKLYVYTAIKCLSGEICRSIRSWARERYWISDCQESWRPTFKYLKLTREECCISISMFIKNTVCISWIRHFTQRLFRITTEI